MNNVLSAREARQRTYEIFRREGLFEQKVLEALELGEQYLGVTNGHFTRIDRNVDHWEILVSGDEREGQFPPGLELDLGITYCRRTIESESQIAFHDAEEQGWGDDPAFEAHGVGCYLGTTVFLDSEPYGTVCFVSDEARPEQFSESELVFAEVCARLIEQSLEREKHEAQLMRQTNLATVLNRILRHNIRNEASAIRGFTQVMADKLEDESYSQRVLDNIDKLLELSDKARELDRVISGNFESRHTDIGALVTDVARQVKRQYPSVSISVEFEEDITASVLPSFERALKELIENAAKHSGENPTITVWLETVPNALEIQVVDNGPGIPANERDVLRSGTETPLMHGSGLGLWLARWIVTSHDGTLDATVTENGTTVTVSIPRQTGTDVQEQLQELTRIRDQYQAAFEETSDAMIIINDHTQIVDANPAAVNIYGIEKENLLGQSVPKFLPDELDFETEWQQFKNDGEIRDTVTVVGGDGDTRPVEYVATTDIVPGQHFVLCREVEST